MMMFLIAKIRSGIVFLTVYFLIKTQYQQPNKSESSQISPNHPTSINSN